MFPLYYIKPNTYYKAFFLAAIISAISAGLAIEIRERNLLGLYKKPEKTHGDTIYNILVTIVITGIVAYLTNWFVRLLFGYGDSNLVK